MKKRTLKYLSLVAMAALVVGCQTGNENASGTTLRYPIGTDLLTLDPIQITDYHTHGVLQNIYEALVKYDEKNEIQPCLAEKWEISEDGKVYTFHLKQGVKFHNGQGLTAEDVKWSFDRVVNPNLKSFNKSFLSDVVGFKDANEGKTNGLQGIKIIDPQTVQITLDAPKADFVDRLAYACCWIVPKGNITSREILKKDQVIGTGPFKFVEFSRSQQIVFKANADYHGGKPEIDAIEIRIIKDSPARLNEYKGGKFDFVELPSNDVIGIREDSAFKDQLVEYQSATSNYMELNLKSYKPFEDRRVRQAFAMAVDKNKIANEILSGLVEVAQGIIPSGFPGFRKNVKSLEFNPEKARKLLAEAGYPDPSKIPPLSLSAGQTASSQSVKPAIDNIALQLSRNLGIKVSVQWVEWSTMIQKLNKKEIPFRFAGWVADYIDPATFIYTTDAPINHSNYSNPEVDRLCSQAARTMNKELRMKLYAQAEDIVLQDAPIAPLFYKKDHFLVSKNVEGLRRNILGFMPFNKVKLKK